MINAFKRLVKENKEKIIRYTNELKKAGFTDNDIQECMDIYNLKYKLMFKEPNNETCEDPDTSYDNGYEKGLYKGAKIQLENIIYDLVSNKISNVVAHKHVNSHDIYITTSMLYNAEEVKYEIITASDIYDENIAVMGEKELHNYTEEYYIVARKNKFNKNYEYLKVNLDGVQQDYEPTEEEIKLFK